MPSIVHEPIYRATMFALKSIDSTETAVMTPVVGALHAEPFQVSTKSIPGYRPYLRLPNGRRGRIDIKDKKTDIGTMLLTCADPRIGTVNGERWFTQYLGDSEGIDRILRAKVLVEESLDNGATWHDFWTGRVTEAKQKDILEFTLLLSDIMSEMDMTLFLGDPSATVAAFAARAPLLPPVLTKPYLNFPLRDTPSLPIGYLRGEVRTATSLSPRYSNFAWDNKSWSKGMCLTKKLFDMAGRVKTGSSGLLQRRELYYSAKRLKAYVTRLDTNASGWFWVRVLVGYKDLSGLNDNHWILGNMGVDEISPSEGGMTWPGVGVDFAATIYGNVAPDEASPLLIDRIHPVTLIKWILEGHFGLLDAAGVPMFSIPYVNPVAMEADTTFPQVAFRITEYAEKGREWLAENICKPLQIGLIPNPSGQLEFIDMRLGKNLDGLDTLQKEDLVSQVPGEGWSSIAKDAINRVDAKYYRDIQMPIIDIAIDNAEWPEVPGGRLVENEQPVIPLYIAPRSTDFPPNAFELDLKGIRANGDLAAPIIFINPTQNWDMIAAENTAERLADELQGPFFAGGQYLNTTCRRNLKTEAIVPGTRMNVAVPTIPNPFTKVRGDPFRAICLERTEKKHQVEFNWLALGPADVSTDPPTLGTLALGSNPKHCVQQLVTLNAEGEPAVWEYAVTPITETVAPTEGWVVASSTLSSATLSKCELPSNSRIWTRAKTVPQLVGIRKPDSVYVYTTDPAGGYVDTSAYPAPTLVLRSNDGSYIIFDIIPGDASLQTEFYLHQGTGYTAWVAADRITTMQPGETSIGISINWIAGDYTFAVRHVDPYGGVTDFSSLTETMSGVFQKAPRPAGIDCVPGWSIMLALFPSDVSFNWAIERAPDNGSNAPDLGQIVRIVNGELAGWETRYLDLQFADTKWWYRALHVREGYLDSDPTPWHDCTGRLVDTDGDGQPDVPPPDVIVSPIEPTFTYIPNQSPTTGTLTVTVSDPQGRFVKAEFKHKAGYGGVETAYAQDPTVPYSDSVTLVDGETSSITFKGTYYKAEGSLGFIERQFLFSKSNVTGAPVDADYAVFTANAQLTNERVLTDSTTVAFDVTTPGIAIPYVPDLGITDAKLSTSGVVAGTYGDATNVPQFTVNNKGRITAVTLVPISGGGGGGGTRTSTLLSTGTIVAGGQATGVLTLAKGTVLYGAKVLSVKKCRFRAYGNSTARDADVARVPDDDAISGSYPAGTGISVDLILAGDTVYALDCDPKPVLGDPTTPGPTTNVYWTVDNLTTDSIAFQIELHHTPLES